METPNPPAGPAAAPSYNIVLDEVVTALRRGDVARAQRALAAAPEAPPAEALVRLAELNMRRRRWHDAAWLFERSGGSDPAAEMKCRLAKNLASLQQHRPALYDLMVSLPADDRWCVGTTATGLPSVVCRRKVGRRIEDGKPVCLSPGNDPAAAVTAAMKSLRPYLDKGQAFALCGAGDGYLLHALARDATPLMLGMRQPVFVLEPEPQALLQAMRIHDFSGPAGPIEQQRFFWFVGPFWPEDLEAAVKADPFLGCPAAAMPLGLDGQLMRERLQQVILSVSWADTEAGGRINHYYAARDDRELEALFGPRPPRTPRVLLLTTRFSSVLQYSTRDAAEAFAQMGWEAKVVIEPTPAHRLYRPGFRAALERFKPDLVFQIDHLRHEHGDLFPPAVPFACWVQDHLPNLTSPAAGAAVGRRDFVLIGMPTMYVSRYGYPDRQCLALTKLTRVPARPAAWSADGEDLVYVSSAAQAPQDAAWELAAPYAGSPEAYELVSEICRRMIALYEAGGALPTHHAVRLFVERVEREVGVEVENPDRRRELIDALFDRLGNVLYRQQSLAWAADLARKHGLRLGIYGPGWDRNPKFAEFARGPVTYGPDLEALTRRSRINLSLEPFFCSSHQRLLDGLVAGGFYLVRDHPTNLLVPALAQFLDCHAPDAATAEAARQAIPRGLTGSFDELLDRCACLAEFGDPVEFVRNSHRAGLLGDDRDPLPLLSDVTFSDAVGMEKRVLDFLADEHRRAEISERQRTEVERRLTYPAGLSRIVAEIGQRLAEEVVRPVVPEAVVTVGSAAGAAAGRSVPPREAA